ncbi:MAG: L-seryl-tRNA(Sec) selenium transferase [Verrucomicrobia bacterium]|nr:L-seryl-tRNA(Sec) selenium transferase [Verrucomicrobiota bacterium]
MHKPDQPLRAVPAVERTLQALGPIDLPRPVVVNLVRRELAALRSGKAIPGFEAILDRVRDALRVLCDSRLQPVINGTGIIVHTNLGRAPLSAAAAEALREMGQNYSNLEYDLSRGERGGRAAYLEHSLAIVCDAQAATVVNNCAAALVLILRHFTRGERKQVVISRGELVQIGGGFRIPEILEASGAQLREIGTTNKTSLGDYSKAIGRETAMVLKVHRSNFFMGGFVESPATEEIAALARKKKIPFVEDLGSGALAAIAKLAPVEPEPTPSEILKKGVDLVCFSGDQLLGGPQAGIIAGKNKLVSALKREPFFRALRCDKLILSALQATVDCYLRQQETTEIPTIEMLRITNEALRIRGATVLAALEGLEVKASLGEGKAQVGGGTSPRSIIPSVTIDLLPRKMTLADFAARLRAAPPGLIGYIAGGRFRIDLRTVFPRQDEQVTRALRSILR